MNSRCDKDCMLCGGVLCADQKFDLLLAILKLKKLTFFLRAKHTNFYEDPWKIITSKKVYGRSIITVLSGWIDVL